VNSQNYQELAKIANTDMYPCTVSYNGESWIRSRSL